MRRQCVSLTRVTINWRFLITGLYLPNVVIATITGMLNLTVPLYANVIGIPYASIGIAAAAVSLGTMCFDMPSSLIFDRVGDRRMVLLSFSCIGVSSLGLILARSFELFVASLVLYGVGISLWGFARIYFIASNIPFRLRGRVSSVFGATLRVGSIAGPVVAGFSLAVYGYSTTYGIVLVLISISTAEFLTSGRAKSSTNDGFEDLEKKTSEVVKKNVGSPFHEGAERKTLAYSRRNTASVIFFQILIMIVRNGRYFLIPLYGVNVLHLDTAAVGLTVGLSGLFDLIAAYPSGYMLDKYGRAPPTALAFALFAAGLLLMSLAGTAALFTMSVLVIGLGNGLSAGILLTLGSDISSQYTGRARSLFLGLWNFTTDGGNALGPIVMGVLSGVFGLVYASRSLALLAFFVCLGLPAFILKSRGPIAGTSS